MKVLVYDFETTDNKRLCAFGGLQYDTVTSECIEFSHYVKIKGPMGWNSSKVHGINREQCDSGMDPQHAINMLWKLTKESDVVVVHNLSSEANCLKNHLTRDVDLDRFLSKGYFDTYRFARQIGFKNTSLVNLFTQIYQCDHEYGDAHDPLVDARITTDIFHYFLTKYGEERILKSIISPKLSRVIGISYNYAKNRWRCDIKVTDERVCKSFPTKEMAESYVKTLRVS